MLSKRKHSTISSAAAAGKSNTRKRKSKQVAKQQLAKQHHHQQKQEQKYKGVHQSGNNYIARYTRHDGKRIYLAAFSNAKKAALAHDHACIQAGHPLTRINFPNSVPKVCFCCCLFIFSHFFSFFFILRSFLQLPSSIYIYLLFLFLTSYSFRITNQKRKD